GAEAWIGREVARGPLPHVAEHLPAAEGAVARRERADVDAAEAIAVEVRELGRGRVVAPGVAALARSERSSRRGLAGRRDLPLELGRQAARSPAAIGGGLELAHVDDGVVRLDRRPAIEVAPLEAAVGAAP